ncbi:MAG: hypothetical protein J0M11_11285, partial [Anaerolineae bacterium]|nr:hypothetical protein [Anaerolineae bacterium]
AHLPNNDEKQAVDHLFAFFFQFRLCHSARIITDRSKGVKPKIELGFRATQVELIHSPSLPTPPKTPLS